MCYLLEDLICNPFLQHFDTDTVLFALLDNGYIRKVIRELHGKKSYTMSLKHKAMELVQGLYRRAASLVPPGY